MGGLGNIVDNSFFEGGSGDAVVGSSYVGNVDACRTVNGDHCLEESDYALVGEKGAVRFHS